MEHSFGNHDGYPPVTELDFPVEWEQQSDHMMFAGDSYNITTSSSSPQTETTNNMIVLGQWPTTDDMMYHQEDYFDDDLDMSKPLEELFNNALYLDNEDDYRKMDHAQGGFLDPLLNVDTTDPDLYGDDSASTTSIGLPLEERYKATLEKLQASMKRSQETRNCLTMKTATTESYERIGSVKEIMSSIATSSGQVQKYVTSIQRQI